MTLFYLKIFNLHQFSGCYDYSLPRHIKRHVDLVQPTIHFSYRSFSDSLLKRSRNLGQPSSGNGPKTSGNPMSITHSLKNCSEQITPDCLRALYKIDYTPCSTDNNTFGIGSFRCLDLVFHIFSMLFLQLNLHLKHIQLPILICSSGICRSCVSLLCVLNLFFFRDFSSSQVGVRPQAVLIDGGS